MNFVPENPATDPSDLIRLRDGIYAADLLVTAIGHLNFFTDTGRNNLDFDGICTHFGIDKRCADVMLTYFSALGLITNENGIYHLTSKSKEYLISDSNRSLVPYFSTLMERPVAEKMLIALKTGEPQSWGGKKDEKAWEAAMEDPLFAEMFTAGMDSRGVYFSKGIINNFDFSGYRSILDIGGASGIYAASIVASNPNLTGGILEKTPVDRIAEISISEKGLQNSISVYEGDMFREIPRGFDIHFFSHVVHDWNPEQNKILLKNSFNSLNREGMIMIHDAHLDAGKNGPLSVAEYSVLLMFSTHGKCYSITEISEMMESAGFCEISQVQTAGNRSIITGKKK